MALGAALVDRARTYRKQRTGQNVEGGHVKGTVISPWFRCRYEEGAEAEQKTEGKPRRVRESSMMVGRTDVTGQPLVLKAADEVEILRRDGSTFRMEIVGNPEEIRKRVAVIGQTARLRKVKRDVRI